ncbi:MAG: hypothetical protein R3C05_17430 [Pirellulaceae bacterium]
MNASLARPKDRRSLAATVTFVVANVLTIINIQANDLATDARSLLRKKCYGCHGEKHQGNAQLDVLATERLVEQGYLVKGTRRIRIFGNAFPTEKCHPSRMLR